MTRKWLEYFLTICESDSMSEAAEKLYTSLPALSAMMKRLEEELGVKLFDRSAKKIKLTEYGKTFEPYAKQAVMAIGQGEESLQRMRAEKIQSITIVTTASLILQPVITKFSQKYPEIKISYFFEELTALKDPSLLDKYHFLMTAPEDWEFTEQSSSMVLYDNDIPVLLVEKSSPYAKKTEIHFKELKNETFITLYKNYSSRAFFDRLCVASGFRPKIAIECDYNMRSYTIREKVGVSVGTLRTLESEPDHRLVAIPIVDPPMRRGQSLYWNPRILENQSCKIFLQFIKDFFHQ